MAPSYSKFPFDIVVISFPDADAAAAASIELESMLKFLPCKWKATTDPYGLRVGSGGATLDAIRTHYSTSSSLEEDSANDDAYPSSGSMLLILAGGESSRCPTQMVLGKAWTSLPILVDEANGTKRSILSTPLLLSLNLLARVLEGLPDGSVVVVAGDTLLHLPNSARWMRSLSEQLLLEECDVIGVAVPASCQTSMNHGVYVFDNELNSALNFETPALRPCSLVWQKPSMEQLQSAYPTDQAWIDTGVVVFLPRVTKSLLKLSAAYFAPIEQQRRSDKALPKLDLYTHILQAFGTTCASRRSALDFNKSRYCDSLYSGKDEIALASTIWDALSVFSLSIWCLPGEFLHLGTSRELVNFLSTATSRTDTIVDGEAKLRSNHSAQQALNSSSNLRSEATTCLSRSLCLVRRCETFTCGVTYDNPESVVASQVLITNEDPSLEVTVGTGTVLEHCRIEVQRNDHRLRSRNIVKIGSDCLLSGIRHVDAKYSLRIPGGMLVQMVATKSRSDNKSYTSSSHSGVVLIVLGIDDPIKSRNTLFGRPFQDFLDWSKLSEQDLWNDETHSSSRTIWTAKLHAIVDDFTTTTIFDWLSDFLLSGRNAAASLENLESLATWRASRRLSLLEIRDRIGDAAAEFAFRRQLAKTIQMEQDNYYQRVTEVISSRGLERIDWRWIVDDFAATNNVTVVLDMLKALDHVVQSSLHDGERQYDVSSRSCRVSSAFLQDLCENGGMTITEKVPCEEVRFTFIEIGTGSMDFLRSQYQAFSSQRNDSIVLTPSYEVFREASRVLDAFAQSLTRRCLFGLSKSTLSWRLDDSRSKTSNPVINRWVIATAPARIDLAGGWTDTPPICFEHGSFVTGIAVLVDGLKPLSCRCRILPGFKGILLRTENRDGRSGNLLSIPVEVRITTGADLNDYRDPSSDCALLKCALVLLGLFTPSNHTNEAGNVESDFQELINTFCHSKEAVGMEVVATSMLPHGSGLGTSSILGGCVIACIERCLGYSMSSDDDMSSLIDSVLELEQLLTTGGGFQDQVNGLIGGAKAVTCKPSVFPLKLQIERLMISEETKSSLNNRLMLAFTGKTRLAKNLLENVLRRWSVQTAEIHEAVEHLALGARKSREALLSNDIETLGKCLSSYWTQKKVMAGSTSGVEPSSICRALKELTFRQAISGASLCGAGGGGFLVVLRAEEVTADDVRGIVAETLQDSPFTWHECSVSDNGLQVEVLDSVTEDFNRVWHCQA